jgi:hypothetical protein
VSTTALATFEQLRKFIRAKQPRKFHLLLGNGFSMAYDPDVFSYPALHTFIDRSNAPRLSELFRIVRTKDLELIMRVLQMFRELADVFDAPPELGRRIGQAHRKLQTGLIEAIRALHPEHVFEIPENKHDACAEFLKVFLETGGNLFTTNYDLLLYWVLMRHREQLRSTDGFGRDEGKSARSELRWRKHRRQRVYYVHGALPLFDTGAEIVKEQYEARSRTPLLEKITARIDQGQYPVFVTAGSSREKLTRIRHDRYLDHCYDALSSVEDSLVTFGFSFGASDDHILAALDRAAKEDKLQNLYIGVFSDTDRKRIESLQGRERFKCKVRIFDSKTVKPWG